MMTHPTVHLLTHVEAWEAGYSNGENIPFAQAYCATPVGNAFVTVIAPAVTCPGCRLLISQDVADDIPEPPPILPGPPPMPPTERKNRHTP